MAILLNVVSFIAIFRYSMIQIMISTTNKMQDVRDFTWIGIPTITQQSNMEVPERKQYVVPSVLSQPLLALGRTTDGCRHTQSRWISSGSQQRTAVKLTMANRRRHATKLPRLGRQWLACWAVNNKIDKVKLTLKTKIQLKELNSPSQ